MENMTRMCIGGVVLLLLFYALTSAVAENQRRECAVCGMWIDQYERTKHVAIMHDGDRAYFCSFACASKYIKVNGPKIHKIKVADFITKQLIDAYNAFYLVDSDIPGVMSHRSMIAFSTSKSAQEFREIHGGRIIAFEGALSEQ
jgi:nitrous oxide reductase accessory protein NosL